MPNWWYDYDNDPKDDQRTFCGVRWNRRDNALHDHVCRYEYHDTSDSFHVCQCGNTLLLTPDEYQELLDAQSGSLAPS